MTVGGSFAPADAAEGAMLGSAIQLGYYATAFSALMIAVAIHEAFVTTPLTVFMQARQESAKRGFSGSMLMASLGIAGLVLAGTLVFLVAKELLPGQYMTLYHVLFFMGLIAPLQLLREFSRRWLLANLEVFPSAVFELAYVTLYLSMLFALVLMANVTAVAAFVAIGIANGIVLVAWWMHHRPRFEFSGESRQSDLKRNFGYGKWVAGENVCWNLTIYLCNWLLLIQINEESAGVFFACFTIMLLANPFLLGVCSLLGPKSAAEFHGNGWNGLMRILFQYAMLVLVVMTMIAAFLWFRGEWLTSVLFDYAPFFERNYGGSNRVTGLLGLSLPFMGLSFVLTAGLQAVQKPIYCFVSSLVGLLVLLGVFTFSTTEPDLLTAAWSFVCAMGANMLCRVLFLIKAKSDVAHSPGTPTVNAAGTKAI